MTTSTRVGLIEDIVISIVVFLVVSLRNTDGTVIQGANSDRQLARRILSVTGHVFWVESDASMDAVTAISGSGPAYVFQFLESYQAAAQSLGFTEAQARNLVLETVAGAVRLAQSEATAFADLRSRVTSKNGTTEAALQVLNECGFAAAICKAVSAAQQRAVAISKDMSKAIG